SHRLRPTVAICAKRPLVPGKQPADPTQPLRAGVAVRRAQPGLDRAASEGVTALLQERPAHRDDQWPVIHGSASDPVAGASSPTTPQRCSTSSSRALLDRPDLRPRVLPRPDDLLTPQNV